MINFKASENTYVRNYIQQGAIELYASPISDGNIEVEVDLSKDIVVDEPEFFVAINLTQYDKAGIDIPLCVTIVTEQNNWKKTI